MKHKIALLGFGNVGQGITEILLKKKKFLKQKFDFEYDIVAIADSIYGNVYNPIGLDAESMLAMAKDNKKFNTDIVNLDNIQLIKQCNADVICEMTFTDLNNGEPAISHCIAAFESGKHVVTSNKGPAALKYDKLSKIAQKHNVKFMIEATVIAGTPIINLAEVPLAGCEITKIKGILNGTTNFILSEMEKGLDYNYVLKMAQEMGYAEADPSGDVEGFDARGKLAILANVVMGVNINIGDITCKGISHLSVSDIDAAKKKNARWKHMVCLQFKDGKLSGSVKPEMVDLSHPLASVMGTVNALTFSTDLLGDVTIIGPGAGRYETGFAILNDLLRIHHTNVKNADYKYISYH